MSRLLLTGGTGFVGRHAAQALTARGYEVLAPGRAQLDLLDGDPGRWLARERPDSLLHLAWYAEPGLFWDSPENLRWVEGSLRLLRAFAAAGGTRAVLAGTCAEYDWTIQREHLAEDAALTPATLYGASKDALRRVAVPWAASVGLSLAWGRIFFPFGPGEPASRLVPSIAAALMAGEDAPMTHGRQIRDLIYVEDLGDAFAALLGSDVTGAVNVASGNGLALRDLAELIARQTGNVDRLRPGALDARPDDPPVLVADVSRLRDEVGWSPVVGLGEGMARTVAALLAGGSSGDRPR